ncbi:MAG: hypothetical protein KAI84_18620, partial [Gammaproteobacteria bacterium]|nr:hypothetical protein [Gammaproteobacteria bacterium]
NVQSNPVILTSTFNNNSNYGIYSSGSNNIRVYYNNFINNTNQAYNSGSNQWDNGYPSGGNYWNDYTGIDIFGGPNQDLKGNDGIGDIAYSISGGGSIDRYPLMQPMGVPSSSSDITIINISTVSHIIDGQEIVISAEIKNNGTSNIFRTILVRFFVDDQNIGESFLDTGLGSGNSMVLTKNWMAEPGYHTITVLVDPDNYLLEPNESNNIESLNLPEIFEPDYIVSNISWSPQTFSTGELITFNATIKNIGNGSTLRNSNTAFLINGKLLGSKIIPGFLKDDSINISRNWIAKSGNYNISIIADYNESIIESNETNNELTRNINYIEGIDEGLVASWLLNEGAGNIVEDSSGNANDGTIYGAIWVDGKFGKALSFDGIDDYVSTISSFNNIENSFTVEIWAYPDATHEIDSELTSGTSGTSGQRYVIWPNHGGSEGAAGSGISMGTNGVSLYEHASSYMPAPLVFADTISGWIHLVVVYENKQPKLYINSNLVKTGLTSPKISVFPSNQIGGGSYGYFKGYIDEVRIYNKTLSEAEIISHYQKKTQEVITSDLTVLNITTPSSITDGQEISISAVITNIGSSDITNNIVTRFLVDNQNIGETIFNTGLDSGNNT